LCIKEGKAVWVLHADIVCLNYDGNILDASLLALTTALKNCKYYGILNRREAKDLLLLLHGKVYFMQKKKDMLTQQLKMHQFFME
jgi:exosome complex RNA-binding protein Rrp42 (RNase PH superfamily)